MSVVNRRGAGGRRFWTFVRGVAQISQERCAIRGAWPLQENEYCSERGSRLHSVNGYTHSQWHPHWYILASPVASGSVTWRPVKFSQVSMGTPLPRDKREPTDPKHGCGHERDRGGGPTCKHGHHVRCLCTCRSVQLKHLVDQVMCHNDCPPGYADGGASVGLFPFYRVPQFRTTSTLSSIILATTRPRKQGYTSYTCGPEG